VSFERDVMAALGRIEQRLKLTNLLEVASMGQNEDILAKITAEGTLIDSIAVLVTELKANQNDPVALQAIVSALDVNDVKLAAIANTPAA